MTPLLSQWTYQAMVADLLGLEDNLLDLADCPQVRHVERPTVGSKRATVGGQGYCLTCLAGRPRVTVRTRGALGAFGPGWAGGAYY